MLDLFIAADQSRLAYCIVCTSAAACRTYYSVVESTTPSSCQTATLSGACGHFGPHLFLFGGVVSHPLGVTRYLTRPVFTKHFAEGEDKRNHLALAINYEFIAPLAKWQKQIKTTRTFFSVDHRCTCTADLLHRLHRNVQRSRQIGVREYV